MFGSKVQWGSLLEVAQTPNWKLCGVDAKPRAWSGEKPSWPVITTVNVQPGPGCPSDDFGTLKVMKREIWLALMATVSYQLGRAAIVDWLTIGLTMASAILLLRYRINSAWLVLGGALIGILTQFARGF